MRSLNYAFLADLFISVRIELCTLLTSYISRLKKMQEYDGIPQLILKLY
jgi:hypothetical protein